MFYISGSLTWLHRNRRRRTWIGYTFLDIIRSRFFRLVWWRKWRLVPSEPIPDGGYQISGLAPIGL